MMEYPGVDPGVSRRYAEAVFERLQSRLAEETAVPVSVLRYVDGDAYQPLGHTQVLNLDDYSAERRARLLDCPSAAHVPHQATCDSSDDADEAFRFSESASPEYSYGSDTSKSGDDLDKRRRPGKRPPGRPKGTGKKLSKRIKSVSVPEFLRDLLLDPKYCPHIIKWEDYTVGV
ncbi:hypothetical protein EVAR_87802_1 [Eumeta japonica]|uniref:Uncharacterized protein n=1 Tax=Eumeta variegata TaxID=151549 RepID=A0A4C1X797_EUMVA|nr:hypothetical protein EVAR_87802_1 [Eumeta japonica]